MFGMQTTKVLKRGATVTVREKGSSTSKTYTYSGSGSTSSSTVGVLPSGRTYNISETSPVIQKAHETGGGIVTSGGKRAVVSSGLAQKITPIIHEQNAAMRQQMAQTVIQRTTHTPDIPSVIRLQRQPTEYETRVAAQRERQIGGEKRIEKIRSAASIIISPIAKTPYEDKGWFAQRATNVLTATMGFPFMLFETGMVAAEKTYIMSTEATKSKYAEQAFLKEQRDAAKRTIKQVYTKPETYVEAAMFALPIAVGKTNAQAKPKVTQLESKLEVGREVRQASDSSLSAFKKTSAFEISKGRTTTIRTIETRGLEFDTPKSAEGYYKTVVKDVITKDPFFGKSKTKVVETSRFDIGTGTIKEGKVGLTAFEVIKDTPKGKEVTSGLLRTEPTFKTSQGQFYQRTSTITGKELVSPTSGTLSIGGTSLTIKSYPSPLETRSIIDTQLGSIGKLKRYTSSVESGFLSDLVSKTKSRPIKETTGYLDYGFPDVDIWWQSPVEAKGGSATYTKTLSGGLEIGKFKRFGGEEVLRTYTPTPETAFKGINIKSRYQYGLDIKKDAFKLTKSDLRTGEQVFSKELRLRGKNIEINKRFQGRTEKSVVKPDSIEIVREIELGRGQKSIIKTIQKQKSSVGKTKVRFTEPRVSDSMINSIMDTGTKSRIKPSIITSIPITKTKPSLLISQQSGISEALNIKQVGGLVQKYKQPTMVKEITTPILKVGVDVDLVKVPEQTQRIIQVPDGGFTSPPPPPPPPIIEIGIPPPPPMKLGRGFWPDSGGSRLTKKSLFKGRYRPSVEAILFNIKGKQPKERLYKTGLSLRPLT